MQVFTAAIFSRRYRGKANCGTTVLHCASLQPCFGYRFADSLCIVCFAKRGRANQRKPALHGSIETTFKKYHQCLNSLWRAFKGIVSWDFSVSILCELHLINGRVSWGFVSTYSPGLSWPTKFPTLNLNWIWSILYEYSVQYSKNEVKTNIGEYLLRLSLMGCWLGYCCWDCCCSECCCYALCHALGAFVSVDVDVVTLLKVLLYL